MTETKKFLSLNSIRSFISDTIREEIHTAVQETAENIQIPIITTEQTDVDKLNWVNHGSMSYTFQSNIRGGQWSVESGSLPTGLSIDESSGSLTGEMTQYGEFTFTLKYVLDGIPCTKTFNCTVAKRLYKVTLDPNGGTMDESKKIIKVHEGEKVGTLPEATKEGEIFGGWFTDKTAGLKVDENYVVNAAVTLYARYGADSSVEFGDAVTQFNLQYDGDRTNYNNQPYTFYYQKAENAEGTGTPSLEIRTGIASADGKSATGMTDTNKKVTLYMKVTNNSTDITKFDIGFDCDSYVKGDDHIRLKRIENGIEVGPADSPYYTVTIPYTFTLWLGKYNERTKNRYNDNSKDTQYAEWGKNTSHDADTGYALTMKNIEIPTNSYTILEVTFEKK